MRKLWSVEAYVVRFVTISDVAPAAKDGCFRVLCLQSSYFALIKFYYTKFGIIYHFCFDTMLCVWM